MAEAGAVVGGGHSIDLDVRVAQSVPLRRVTPATLIGKGVVERIKGAVEEHGIGLVVVEGLVGRTTGVVASSHAAMPAGKKVCKTVKKHGKKHKVCHIIKPTPTPGPTATPTSPPMDQLAQQLAAGLNTSAPFTAG